MRNKLSRLLCCTLALLIACTFVPAPALAQAASLPGSSSSEETESVSSSTDSAQSTAESEIGFYVRAIIPENQVDPSFSYFNLRMTQGQEQDLEVEIVNELDHEIEVSVSAISASTNRNGIIDYRTPDIRDETLLHPFSEIAQVQQPVVRIPAFGAYTVSVHVEMPQEQYNGVILGGLVFRKTPENQMDASSSQSVQSTEDSGITIENVYNYVIGVLLSETDTVVPPDFEFFNVKAETVSYQASTVHYIRNRAPNIVKNLEIDVNIYRDGESEPIAHVNRIGVDMAPNSVMELVATMPGNRVEPGDYTSVMKLTLGDETWDLEQKFRIGAEEANEVNSGVIDIEPTTGLPTWLIVLIIVLVVVILLLLFLLLFFMRKKKQEEREAAIKVKAKNKTVYRRGPNDRPRS